MDTFERELHKIQSQTRMNRSLAATSHAPNWTPTFARIDPEPGPPLDLPTSLPSYPETAIGLQLEELERMKGELRVAALTITYTTTLGRVHPIQPHRLD